MQGNTVSQRINPAQSVGLGFGTINATSNVSVPLNLSPSPALDPAKDLALVMPRTALPAGITIYARISDADTVTIIGVNATAGNIVVGNIDVTVFILKGTGQQIAVSE